MGTRTTLNDLNEYLFHEMDRLTNEDLSAEELDKEIKRSDALQKVAKTIIDNGSLALQAKKYLDEPVEAPTVVHMKMSAKMLIPIISRKLKERGL